MSAHDLRGELADVERRAWIFSRAASASMPASTVAPDAPTFRRMLAERTVFDAIAHRLYERADRLSAAVTL